MASSYSILRTYGDYIQPFNFDLIEKGLAYKQQKFGTNTAVIQKELDTLGSIDLAKDSDKDYLQNKLSTLVNAVNSSGSLDLSEGSVTRGLQNNLKQVLDDNVLNAYQGTQALRNLQSSIADTKKNRPEAYSDRNAWFALQGANQWLNDGEVGSEYGGGSYTDYVDIEASEREILKDLYKESDSSVQYPEVIDGQPTGRMITQKFKGLEADQIEFLHNQTLQDPAKQKQIQINAAYTFGQNPQGALDAYNNYSNSRLKELDNSIANAKNRGDQDALKFYESKRLELRDTLDRFGTTDEAKLANIGNISVMLEKERILGNVKNEFKKRQTDFEYEEDKAFFSKLKALNAAQKTASTSNKTLTNSQGQVVGLPEGVDIALNAEEELENTEGNFVDEFNRKNKAVEDTTVGHAERLYNTPLINASEIDLEVDRLVETSNMTPRQAKATAIYNKVSKIPASEQTGDTMSYLLEYKDYKDSLQEQTDVFNEVKQESSKFLDSQLVTLTSTSTEKLRDKYNKYLSKGAGFTLVSDKEFETSTAPNKKRLSDLNEEETTNLRRVTLADAINTKINNNDSEGLEVLTELLADTFGEDSRVDVIQDVNASISNAFSFGVGLGDSAATSLKIDVGNKTRTFLDKTNEVGIQDTFTFVGENSVEDLDNFRSIYDGTMKSDVEKAVIKNKSVNNIGSKSLVINSVLDGKNTVKRGETQNGVMQAIKSVISQPNTTIGTVDGDLYETSTAEGAEVIGENKVMSLLSNKDTTFRITPSSEGFSKVTFGNNLEINVKTIDLERELSKTLPNIDLGALNRNSSFTSTNRESREPASFIKEEFRAERENLIAKFAGQEFGFDTQNSKIASPMSTSTAEGAFQVLNSTFNLDDTKKQEVKQILLNSDKLNTEIKLKDNEIYLSLLNPNGTKLSSFKLPKSASATNQFVDQQYKTLVRAQTVSPGFILEQYLESVLRQELQGEETLTSTLTKIANSVQQ